MSGLGLFALVVGLLILRQSLMLVLFSAVIYIHFVWGDQVLTYVAMDVWGAYDKAVVLSIPLFILLGVVMSRGVIAQRLVDFIIALTRPIPGGLAVATILSCAVFSSISGSSIVTMLAVGVILHKALIENGYQQGFAVGLICAGGTLGIIIPPSIPLILYGVVTETSVASLFLAGLGPGLLLTTVFTVYAVGLNWHIRGAPYDRGEIWTTFKASFWPLTLPVVLLGGIYSGFFSPTESAAVALFYAILVETLITRELNLRKLYEHVVEAGAMVGVLFPLIAATISLNLLVAEYRVPQMVIEWTLATFDTQIGFVLAVNALLLFLGAFMDTISAILVTAPVLPPVAEQMGLDKVHLGILMILNLEIGYLTPPFGLNLIVAMSAFKVSFLFAVRAALPFIGLMMLCLALVIWQPWIALGLVY